MSEQEHEGQDIVSLAKELDQKRSDLRDAKQEADKVPALRREIERLEASEQKLKDKLKSSNEHAGDLDRQKAELESKLRDQGDAEAEVEDSLAEAAEAQEAAEKAKEAQAEAEKKLGEVEAQNEQLRSTNEQLKQKADHLDHLVDLGVAKGV